jgi:hypothetical protein
MKNNEPSIDNLISDDEDDEVERLKSENERLNE